MLLDAHAHLFHPSWYPSAFIDQLLSSLPAGISRRADVGRALLRVLSDDSGGATIRAMDRAGIDRRIILVLDWGLELGEAELSIEDVHRAVLGICARYPDRLIGFAGLDPRRPRAPQLLVWAIEELGARGLKLHPTSPGWSLEDEATIQLVEVAASRGLPVVVHIGATFPALTDRHSTPGALLRLARRFAGTTFVAAHGGFHRWREFQSDEPMPPNVLLDVSAWQGGQPGQVPLEQDLSQLLGCFPGRVVFGTDSPFSGLPGSEREVRWISRLRVILDKMGQPDDASFFSHRRLVAGGDPD